MGKNTLDKGLPPRHSYRMIFSRVHATLQPALSVGRSVGRLVGRSVTLYFFYDFISLTSLLLPKWSGDLKYGPCPPARDFGSRVSGLVFLHEAEVAEEIKKPALNPAVERRMREKEEERREKEEEKLLVCSQLQAIVDKYKLQVKQAISRQKKAKEEKKKEEKQKEEEKKKAEEKRKEEKKRKEEEERIRKEVEEQKRKEEERKRKEDQRRRKEE